MPKPDSFSTAEMAVLKAVPDHPGVAERLAEVMRSVRVSGVEGCSATYADLSSQFMAPVTITFASWVLAKARERGIERLYFLSRDCQLALEAAKILSPEFGGIDCRYLQVSRQALMLPSFTDVSEQGMPWLIDGEGERVLKCLLVKIEMDYEEIAPFFPKAAEVGGDYVLKTDEDRQAFWAALRQPVLHDKLTQLIENRRSAARIYFEGMGLFDSVKWAVIDVGWSLNCQRAFAEQIRGWGREEEVHGFFLGVRHDRQPERKTGPIDALFYQQPPEEGVKTVQPAVFKFMVLIENLFGTADHPMVHHYEVNSEGQAVPAYKERVPEKTLSRYRALKAGYMAFAERCRGFSVELAEPSVAAALVDALTLNFLNHADARMVKPLRDIEVGFGRDSLDPFPLVYPLTMREAIAPVFPSWSFLKKLRQGPRVMWHKGSVLISSSKVRKMHAVAYRLRAVRLRVKFLR